MKKIILFIVLVSGVLFYPSCSNDIDLATDWKDIPVVYGLISPSKSANYIRVEKAFLDNEKNALELAQIADSLYYDDITVQISGNGSTYNLVRVDGNTEGFPREEGIFANAPNYLYKLDVPVGELIEGELYSLNINRGDNLPPVTSQTVMVDEIDIRDPEDPDDEDPIRWESSGFEIEWRTKTSAHIFDAWIYIHISEEDPANPANNKVVTLNWKIEENLSQEVFGNDLVRGETNRLTKLDLFNYLAGNLEVNPNIIRRILSFDIEIIAGGEELSDYIATGNANTGITSTQVIPTFTNLSEGRGIFSSQNSTLQEGYRIDGVTIDSIRNNGITRDLNFQL